MYSFYTINNTIRTFGFKRITLKGFVRNSQQVWGKNINFVIIFHKWSGKAYKREDFKAYPISDGYTEHKREIRSFKQLRSSNNFIPTDTTAFTVCREFFNWIFSRNAFLIGKNNSPKLWKKRCIKQSFNLYFRHSILLCKLKEKMLVD